jgi:hypothetical protein
MDKTVNSYVREDDFELIVCRYENLTSVMINWRK